MSRDNRFFPRSQQDIWPWHGVITHHRSHWRWAHVVRAGITFAALAAIGVMLAWRG